MGGKGGGIFNGATKKFLPISAQLEIHFSPWTSRPHQPLEYSVRSGYQMKNRVDSLLRENTKAEVSHTYLQINPAMRYMKDISIY